MRLKLFCSGAPSTLRARVRGKRGAPGARAADADIPKAADFERIYMPADKIFERPAGARASVKRARAALTRRFRRRLWPAIKNRIRRAVLRRVSCARGQSRSSRRANIFYRRTQRRGAALSLRSVC